MDDSALIKAIAAGDDLALKELFERHAPLLGLRIRRILAPHAVEDVLQETFIAAWRSAGSYHGDGAVGAWLWGIARRQAALWLRRHGQPSVAFESERVAPDDTAAEAIHAADLEQALATLGAPGSPQRELVRLAWLEERPISEVAAHLAVPQGTVKSRLHKVRGLLRKALRLGDDT